MVKLKRFGLPFEKICLLNEPGQPGYKERISSRGKPFNQYDNYRGNVNRVGTLTTQHCIVLTYTVCWDDIIKCGNILLVPRVLRTKAIISGLVGVR